MLARTAPLLALLVACGSPARLPDAGRPDAGRPDGGASDGGSDGGRCAAPAVTVVAKGEKVLQLIGDTDRALGMPTLSRTFTRFGLAGTDLGASFVHNGKLWFLFGDSAPSGGTFPNPLCGDAIGFTTQTAASDAEQLALSFVATDAGFESPSVSGVDLGCFNVPLAGVSGPRGADGGSAMYVWFSTNCMSKSVLAKTIDGAHTFTPIAGYALSDCGCNATSCNVDPSHNVCTDYPGCHFVNVSVDSVAPQLAGLPADAGEELLFFGSGKYRASNVYLAREPLRAIENAGQLEYFGGLADGGCGPTWTSDPHLAAPLFSSAGEGFDARPCVGELSVHWVPALSAFLALYNCGGDIRVRAARQPWGPWSASAIDISSPDGYCRFIYQPDAGCPQLADPGASDVLGGLYGPYLIGPYTQAAAQGATVYYVVSPWNPYDAMLLKTDLSVSGP